MLDSRSLSFSLSFLLSGIMNACLSGTTDADAIEIYCSIASESVFVVLFQLKKDFVKMFPVSLPLSVSLEWAGYAGGCILYSVLHCAVRQSLGKSVTLVENQNQNQNQTPSASLSHMPRTLISSTFIRYVI